jgi:hypothetical protein
LSGQSDEALEALQSAVRLDVELLEKARAEPVFADALSEDDWLEVSP